MKKRVILTMLPIMAIALETLPYGAVLRFASDAERIDIKTYSYFDLTPFGYANFGPLLTAILTLMLIVFAAVNLFKPSVRLGRTILVTSIIAVITSLMPLMFGIAYFTLVAVMISVILACEVAVSVLMRE